jgi:hypothetical protein
MTMKLKNQRPRPKGAAEPAKKKKALTSGAHIMPNFIVEHTEFVLNLRFSWR